MENIASIATLKTKERCTKAMKYNSQINEEKTVLMYRELTIIRLNTKWA